MRKLLGILVLGLLWCNVSYALTYKSYKDLLSNNSKILNAHIQGMLNGIQGANTFSKANNLYKDQGLYCPPENLAITFENAHQLLKDQVERDLETGINNEDELILVLLTQALAFTFPCK